MSPRDTIRAWLPHLAMLLLVGGAVWLVAAVFAPLLQIALVAACLVALTHALLFAPLERLALRTLPALDAEWRRSACAIAATVILVAALASPLVLLLVTSLDGMGEVWSVVVGLALREQEQVARVADIAAREVRAMRVYYPDLPFDPEEVRTALAGALGRSQGGALYGYLFRGTGGVVAQLVLGLMLVYGFYADGGRLARRLLAMVPLTDVQRDELARRFRHSVLHLLNDTIAMAVAKGLLLGVLAWAIAGYNLTVVALVATFIGLIPVVGYASVWLPLCGVLWQQERPLAAVSLALASLVAAWLVDRLGLLLTRGLEARDRWMSFLLFLSLIGGVLGFGAKGLVIGPTAVVVLVVLASFWLPLYGVGSAEPVPDEQPPRAGA